jgi:antitoxin VapB
VALNIKDPETERLAAEIAAATGENKTQAIRTALRQRKERLARERGGAAAGPDLVTLLETNVWPLVQATQQGAAPSKAEREQILGYGPDGA